MHTDHNLQKATANTGKYYIKTESAPLISKGPKLQNVTLVSIISKLDLQSAPLISKRPQLTLVSIISKLNLRVDIKKYIQVSWKYNFYSYGICSTLACLPSEKHQKAVIHKAEIMQNFNAIISHKFSCNIYLIYYKCIIIIFFFLTLKCITFTVIMQNCM